MHILPLLRVLDYYHQEYKRYKDRLLKAENQLVNALGFDFMIEHPFGHASDLLAYLTEEGEARGCQERKLCVLCSGTGVCRTGSFGLDWREAGVGGRVVTYFQKFLTCRESIFQVMLIDVGVFSNRVASALALAPERPLHAARYICMVGADSDTPSLVSSQRKSSESGDRMIGGT